MLESVLTDYITLLILNDITSFAESMRWSPYLLKSNPYSSSLVVSEIERISFVYCNKMTQRKIIK